MLQQIELVGCASLCNHIPLILPYINNHVILLTTCMYIHNDFYVFLLDDLLLEEFVSGEPTGEGLLDCCKWPAGISTSVTVKKKKHDNNTVMHSRTDYYV